MDEKPARRQALAATQVPLPPERAFVVQLRVPADPDGDLFVGRAEHLASGAAERFDSVEALIAFIVKVLAPECPGTDSGAPRRSRGAP